MYHYSGHWILSQFCTHSALSPIALPFSTSHVLCRMTNNFFHLLLLSPWWFWALITFSTKPQLMIVRAPISITDGWFLWLELALYLDLSLLCDNRGWRDLQDFKRSASIARYIFPIKRFGLVFERALTGWLCHTSCFYIGKNIIIPNI